MQYGTIFKDTVSIGTLELGECEVITGMDGTMTVRFPKCCSLGDLDEVLSNSPMVKVGEEESKRTVQAYRIDANTVEVSFVSNFVTEEPEEQSEVKNAEE